MEPLTVNPEPVKQRSARWARYTLLLFISLVLVGFFAYRLWVEREPATTRTSSERISANALEQRYGMQVKLIGVTAAGGLVDFRLKILDAEKAKPLLNDQASMPMLLIEDSGATLRASEKSTMHDIKLVNGGMMFILFPNTRSAVKPGTPVTVVFGGIRLEPITAQ